MQLRKRNLVALLIIASYLVGCGGDVPSKQEETKTIQTNLISNEQNVEEQSKVQVAKETKETPEPSKIPETKKAEENKESTDKEQEKVDSTKSNQRVDHTVSNDSTKVESKKQTPPKQTTKETVTTQTSSKSLEVKDEKEEPKVSLSIDCSTILNNKKAFNSEKLELLPKDGVILSSEEISYEEGETVFDVLVKATKAHKIHMEYTGSTTYNTNYIEGINNIYEFDCGALSGWMYCVNGKFPNYGCSNYKLQDGDVIEWIYTCDLGKDIGAEEALGEGGK